MTREAMIAEVEEEISRLAKIRELLAGSNSERFVAPTATDNGTGKVKGKRTLSPEARKRIALAQKRRWAKQKSEAKK